MSADEVPSKAWVIATSGMVSLSKSATATSVLVLPPRNVPFPVNVWPEMKSRSADAVPVAELPPASAQMSSYVQLPRRVGPLADPGAGSVATRGAVRRLNPAVASRLRKHDTGSVGGVQLT